VARHRRRRSIGATALLEKGTDPDFRDGQGETLLTIATHEEYSAEKTILLLDHGASVNFANSAGDTPLMIAADRYQSASVKALLDHGADARCKNPRGATALMLMALNGSPALELLLDEADRCGCEGRGRKYCAALWLQIFRAQLATARRLGSPQ
jgi:ankyrin repeat protein